MTEAVILPVPDNSATLAIEVSHLSKTFLIRHEPGSVKRALIGLLRKPRIEHFHALQDVSFTVPHGQTLAVIGRNGSGKSTLLSLLANVYRPTAGTIELRGETGGKARVAPLLELGAGFHPELDGLTNISFYGAMLGLTAEQMRAKRDTIIAFAELGDKVDTLVRGWNDGAKLRLGFSIAVNTDADILLVDEVLAVGDEAFQNKCYRLIGDLQAQGKTILFVSHDLAVVERVASRVLWLREGRIEQDGDAHQVLQAYRHFSTSESQ